MTHDEACALLPSYAAANLDLAEAARVRGHLVSGCADCLRELFNRPVGLPRPVSRAQAPKAPPAPRSRRRIVMAAVSAVVVAGLSAWMARVIVARVIDRRQTPAARQAVHVAGPAFERDAAASRPDVSKPRIARPEPPRPPAEPETIGGGGVVPSAGAGLATARDVERRAPLVTYAQDVVSVRVVNAPLSAVLEEIGRQSGATIRGDAGGREVSATFDGVPLPEALHRLLGEQNFVLVYDDQRHPRVVELLDGPSRSRPAETGSPVGADGSASQRAAESLEETMGLLVRRRPVALSGALAEALGTDTMPLGQLLDVGVHHADKAVRAAAMRAWVETLEGDDELRSAVLGTLATMDDAALADLVRGLAGEHAEEALFYVATQSNGALRVKAAALLQQLHAGTEQVPRADG